jgi:hypothetical protein
MLKQRYTSTLLDEPSLRVPELHYRTTIRNRALKQIKTVLWAQRSDAEAAAPDEHKIYGVRWRFYKLCGR